MRVANRHLPSLLTLAALVIFHHRPLYFATSLSIYLDHDYTNTCPSIRFPRSRYLGHALARAPLAYLPSLHLSVSSRLSAPSRCVLANPPACDQCSGDMICRCGVAESPPLTRFGSPSPHPASFSGGFLPGRWRFRSLLMTLVGTASPQYNISWYPSLGAINCSSSRFQFSRRSSHHYTPADTSIYTHTSNPLDQT